MGGLAEDEGAFSEQRSRMVERDLRRRGIRDARVLETMGRVPRHLFVSPSLAGSAYADAPLPTAEGQTISQPYIVALMTEALALSGGEKVLELGTGSGYQTAVLTCLGADVWSIERSRMLWEAARARLSALGFPSVHLILGDGTAGLAAEAPFDRVLATGSLPGVPPWLTDQLRPRGVFVGPIGGLYDQRLVRMEYDPPHMRERVLCACRFVPLVGAAGWPEGSAPCSEVEA